MINKRYILLILSTLAFVINTMAQAAEEDCYGDNRTKGISSYNSGKYAEAKKYFQSAQNCDMKPKQNDIARWIDNCNKKINEQKQAQTPKQQTQIAPEMQPVQVYAEQGALYGVFSVSPTKKVRFSQGNLQYRASTNTWRFAEHQYDMIGKANKNISSTYAGWIDLFGWGTSGYNGKFPYMTSTEPTNYGNGSSDITGTNYDWGVYNKISNGGNQAGFWRTLTYIEWNYLINSRINAKIKYGVACVNGVDGLIFLPDNWTLPSGLSFTNGTTGHYSQNTYTSVQWSEMEANGAVFLPATGMRFGTEIRNIDWESFGKYWTSSYRDSYYAIFLDICSYLVPTTVACAQNHGLAVRLVQDVK